MKKDNNSWSKPKLLGAPFNRVCHTTFTKNGKMYYTREDMAALYKVSYINGVFGQSEKLDTIINSTKVQYNCLIAPDERYLIFTSSSRSDGLGKGDLYISFRNNKNEWCEPINMGPEINSASLESCPSISNNGEFLFFTSNIGGNNDVYWVDIKIIDIFEYIINSSFDKTISIIVDNKEIGVSFTKPQSFKQLDINSSHFSMEASNGIIQIENNQLIITIIKR